MLLKLLILPLLAGGGILLAIGPRSDDPAAAVEPFAAADAASSSATDTVGPAASQREPAAARPARGESAESTAAAQRAPRSDEPKGPRTEAEHLAVLRALARSDPEAFGRRVESLLAGTGPAYEQFAALRAAYEEDWPGVVGLCVRAVSLLPRASGPEAESVPETLVLWLSQRAAREPRAREALAAVVWIAPAVAESTFRSRALRALVQASPEAELQLLARRIHAESDPHVHSAGRAALDERAQQAPTSETSQEFP